MLMSFQTFSSPLTCAYLRNNPRYHRASARPNQHTPRKYRHRRIPLFSYKGVRQHTSHDGPKRRRTDTDKEPGNQHARIGPRDTTAELTHSEEDAGKYKDRSLTIELREGSKYHGGESEADAPGRKADGESNVTDVPEAGHLGDRRAVCAGAVRRHGGADA